MKKIILAVILISTAIIVFFLLVTFYSFRPSVYSIKDNPNNQLQLIERLFCVSLPDGVDITHISIINARETGLYAKVIFSPSSFKKFEFSIKSDLVYFRNESIKMNTVTGIPWWKSDGTFEGGYSSNHGGILYFEEENNMCAFLTKGILINELTAEEREAFGIH